MQPPPQATRTPISDGQHTAEVLSVLGSEIKFDALQSISQRAAQIIQRSVDPIAGPPEAPSDGLLYGLIQSGKTSILTVAAAMAADNGFRCVVVLTSDIDLLYDQTLERVRRALRGLTVLGKNDWKDAARFERQIRSTPFVVVCSKNGNKLNSLLEAFKKARAKGLSALIIDDEADQASLNTFTNKGGAQISRINQAITDFRDFFAVNTYLQVTATPQALFLQRPDHSYRPSFTVLSEPGPGYVGGEAFFGPQNQLLRLVPIDEVDELCSTHQPAPSGVIPVGLARALFTFLVAATAKVLQHPANGYAFLCHVSIKKVDHDHIVTLIDRFKEETARTLRGPASNQQTRIINELKAVYDDLSGTQPNLPAFDLIVEKIKFYLPGANIKLVNATSEEEIKLDSVYNIFVGGNKLGRGVTIKNLLVSYYGRNPRRPNADTVLQHARMYGYRQDDLGVTRLFLPDRLAEHFRLIHQMENALRELVKKYPEGKFEGIFISTPLRATRTNVLDPNSLGMYVAEGSYNPIYPLRDSSIATRTLALDSMLSSYTDEEQAYQLTVDDILKLLEECIADPRHEGELWNPKTITAALEKIKTIFGDKAYIVVKRGRNLNTPRRETQGVHTGGELDLAPKDAPTLFMFRQNPNQNGESEVWWPQLRFPEGNYVLAFSFE